MKTKLYRNRIVALLLISVLTFVIAACGKSEDKGTSESTKPASSSSSATEESSKPKEEVTINIGVQGKTGILPYARSKGLFEKALAKDNIKVTWNEFASGPPHFEAIAAGRIDFGSVGGTPVISGQVGDVGFKAVAVTSDGRKGNMIIVPKDSPIKELKDLKGKKVGVAKGSSAYNFLYMAIDKAGLTGDDVKVIQLQPDEARPALDSGAIDAWSIWEPYATVAEHQTGATVLVSGEDLNINAPGFLIARTKFLDQHPDAAVAFLKAYEEVRLYYSTHIDEVAGDLADAAKLEKEVLAEVMHRTEPLLSPITPEFAKAHQEQADFLFKVGAINKQLDTSKVLDSKYVEQALAELKEGK
ncbi:aliphatic sulfonate ABC transporter substrate-binding protein [Paenibacillus kobensis]|uniref:aliphatic sulfonate ABC transporter substrate-binding protein n=1 Tax=Paenibacillus kobensis TaxID=59841 RepID=UPI000FDAF7E6|nr:aliphatic sulfonate ABC transporter substrate-binding protein [Paenibacillus kobensis]